MPEYSGPYDGQPLGTGTLPWHMKEVNKLTRRLLAEGYTPEDTPPGTRKYDPYEGGWTYDRAVLMDMVFETPCGLLAEGQLFLNGYLSFYGIDWRPENDNPVLVCPCFPSEPCPLRDPSLQRERLNCHSDDVIFQCACHQTDRPYTFEGSVEEANKKVWQEAQKRWDLFQAAHKGRVCRHQSRYGRTSKTWNTYYDPIQCATDHLGCTHCSVLDKDLVPQKGNVFYDLRKTWIKKGDGLFPDEQRVSIEKGCKLLAKTVSLTICEAIVKYGQQEVVQRIMLEFHHDLYFDHTLKIEVLNLRAARVDTRDILQDLQDVANGIQVTHAADTLKEAKEQKKARREAAKRRRIRKVEQMLLTYGWADLDAIWQHRAEKLLDDERIEELLQQRKEAKAQKPPEELQVSLF